MMNKMLSLALRPLSPHRTISAVATTSRYWSCYFSSVSAPKTPSEEDLVASFSSWNCIGSSHGWLGYVEPGDHSFYLFKPSLVNHPSYLPFISLPRLHQFSCHQISKMIFSSSPTPIQRLGPDNDNNNSSVLAVLTLNLRGDAPTAFCRIGDPNWTRSNNFPRSQMPMKNRAKYLCPDRCFQDIVYDSKRNLFYVITNSGEIYSWDLSNFRYSSTERYHDCSFEYLIKPPTTEFPPGLSNKRKHLNQGIKYYLVMDKVSGALLMIRLLIYYTSYKDNPNSKGLAGGKSYIHDMHSLDLDNKLDSEWLPVKGLVDTALFIGRNNGTSIDARQVPGLVTPGYIYLACTAFRFFQLSALCFSSSGQSYSEDYISILRADEMENGYYIGSFPVWNIE